MTFEDLKTKLDAYTVQSGVRLDTIRMNSEEYHELFNYPRTKLYNPYTGVWIEIPEEHREARPAHPDWEYLWVGGDLHVKVIPDTQVPKGEVSV